jgi:ankyrin repeat protein
VEESESEPPAGKEGKNEGGKADEDEDEEPVTPERDAGAKDTEADGAATDSATKEVPTSTSISPKGEEQTPPAEPTVENGKSPEIKEKAAAKQKKPMQPQFHCPHNLNERDNDENTILHVAIHARKLEHVKLLLLAGASVHKKSDGSPPIHVAISMGSIAQHAAFAYQCVVVLKENGADLSAKDDAMHTPLYLACMYNLPQIVNFFLSTEEGLSTLNVRADRSGGRALHAASKFCNSVTGKIVRVAAAAATAAAPHHHHPDGTVANSMHHIPGFPAQASKLPEDPVTITVSPPSPALLTQVLLETPGIEIDAINSVGQTPLHIACMRGNWRVARLLLQAGASPDIADRRGYTPGQHAHKRGMPIPIDLLQVLGGPPSSGTVPPPRDLIVDPDSNTLLLSHELCTLHRSCAPIQRDSHSEPPPENVRRLQVLVDEQTGILRTGEFDRCTWESEARRAAIVDVLKVSLIFLKLLLRLHYFSTPLLASI